MGYSRTTKLKERGLPKKTTYEWHAKVLQREFGTFRPSVGVYVKK